MWLWLECVIDRGEKEIDDKFISKAADGAYIDDCSSCCTCIYVTAQTVDSARPYSWSTTVG